QGICLLNRHQTGDTDSVQLVILLPVQRDSQETFIPCEARMLWYSAVRTSSQQLRDTTVMVESGRWRLWPMAFPPRVTMHAMQLGGVVARRARITQDNKSRNAHSLSRVNSGGDAVYLLTVARRIAGKDACLFEAFSCPWTPSSPFYTLRDM